MASLFRSSYLIVESKLEVSHIVHQNYTFLQSVIRMFTHFHISPHSLLIVLFAIITVA